MNDAPQPRFKQSEVNAFLNYAPFNYKHQRLGQAFCNHFSLYKLPSGQELERELYELDGADARKLIEKHTDYVL